MKIKVMLVDDHHIVRDGIKALLIDDPNIEICGEAGSKAEMMELLKSVTPDILVLDIALPDGSGIEVARSLSVEKPDIRILILSMYTDSDFIHNAIEAGVKGYIPKNTTKKELNTAIHLIADDEEYFSDEISKIFMKNFAQLSKSAKEIDAEIKLTKREEEILTLFAEGKSNQCIAEDLFISIRTVECHKNNIMHKLGFKSTVDLVKFAIKKGYIEL